MLTDPHFCGLQFCHMSMDGQTLASVQHPQTQNEQQEPGETTMFNGACIVGTKDRTQHTTYMTMIKRNRNCDFLT